MNPRIVIAILSIVLALGTLIGVAVSSSAKEVVTVSKLADTAYSNDQKFLRSSIRLGARVSQDPIQYQTNPDLLLQFRVHDIGVESPTISVRYHGIMPDTLKSGRDVILEGRYENGVFVASSLLTQCPSKYEVPMPDAM